MPTDPVASVTELVQRTHQVAHGTLDEHRFDVFISYSRRDAVFARRLQHALSGYTPPKDLPVPQRRLRVFRDESDFVGIEYGAALEESLRSAAKLLVICSPDSRSSPYVGGEIAKFAALRGKDHIVSVLIAGAPNNEGPPTGEQAFHDELVHRLPVPLAADYRGWNAKRDRIERDRFESAWHKLLADIYAGYGIDRSGIEQREKMRQRRTRRIRTAVMSGIVLVLASLTVWALISRQEAIAQRNTAQSRFLAAQSLSGAHPYDVALLLGVAAHRAAPSFEAWEALFVGLQRQPTLQRFLYGVDAPVRRIVVGPAATCTAAWTESGKTVVWDLATGRVRGEIAGHAMPDHGCRSVVVASADGEVALHPLDRLQERRWSLAPSAPVTAWAFDPGDSTLVLAHAGGLLFVRGVEDGRVGSELTHSSTFAYLRFSADGRALAGIDDQGIVHRWDARTLAPLSPPARCVRDAADVFAISSDMRWCAAGGPGRLVLTDLAEGGAVEHDLGAPWILALDFSHDGRTVMAGVQGGDLQFWNIEQALRDGARARPTAWSEHRGDVTAAAWASDGGAIVSAARDRSVIVWHPNPPDRLVSEAARVPENSAVGVDAGARTIVTGTAGGDLSVVTLGPDNVAATPSTNLGQPVTAVALGTDGAVLAGTAEGALMHLEGQSLRTFPTTNRGAIARIRFNSDQSLAAALAENGVMTLWDVAAGTLLTTFAGERSRDGRAGGITPGVDAAFEPDGARLVSVHGDQQAVLWGVSAGAARSAPLVFRPTSYFTSAAFAADTRTVALGTGLYEGEVVLIDIGSPGAPVTRLPGHDLQDVTALAFSPDGRLLFSGGFDQRVMVWDVAGRRRIGDPHRAGGAITGLTYATDGSAVTAVTDRGVVLRWDLDPGHWREIACRIANRDLSAEERARFMDGTGGTTVCP